MTLGLAFLCAIAAICSLAILIWSLTDYPDGFWIYVKPKLEQDLFAACCVLWGHRRTTLYYRNKKIFSWIKVVSEDTGGYDEFNKAQEKNFEYVDQRIKDVKQPAWMPRK